MAVLRYYALLIVAVDDSVQFCLKCPYLGNL
jgi:hypothetical protein